MIGFQEVGIQEQQIINELKNFHNHHESQPDQDCSNVNHKEVKIIDTKKQKLVINAIECLNKAVSMINKIEEKHEIIFEPKQQEELTDKFIKLIRSLKNLQVHFFFLLDILESPEQDIPKILKRYDPIVHLYKSITKKDDFTVYSVKEALEVAIYSVIDQVEKATDLFLVQNNEGKLEMNMDLESLDYIQIVTSKIETVLEYFPRAVTLEKEDVFAYERESEVWKRLYQDAEIHKFPKEDNLKNQVKAMFQILTVANAILYKSHKDRRENTNDTFQLALDGLYFSLKKKEAEVKSSLYLTDPKMESAFKLWNLPDQALVGSFLSLKLPTIDYDKRIFVHRLFSNITRDMILKEYENGSLNTIIETTFKPVDLNSKKELIIESIFNKKSDAVPVRIISPSPLIIQGANSEKARAMAMKAVNMVSGFLNQGNSKNTDIDGIIIHMHGGGFVSGSSSSHRNYLYRWAKNLNKIIFSIDYRLAPDYPYPAGIDDVWQAYNWIVNYAETLLGIKTYKIILAGDSAGGNLALALALRTIKMGIRVPDGCFLAYPALSMYPKQFVPSYWLALEDMLLPYSVMKLCIQAYIPNEFKADLDPFLSPVVAGENLLSKLPPVRIVTGDVDPMHDINWRFLDRMQKLGKDVKMKVYKGMPHAFLSLDQLEEFPIVMEDSCKMLQDLFSDKNNQ